VRGATVSFSAQLILFAVVLAFISEKGGNALRWLAALAVIALGTTLFERTIERPLDCSSAIGLAGSYRTRYFLRVAFAEAVALWAFVFAFIGAPTWIYYVGALFALVRLWTGAAPTRAALAADQADVTAQGCGLSLIAALRGRTDPGS
jgi:hypothetical protein